MNSEFAFLNCFGDKILLAIVMYFKSIYSTSFIIAKDHSSGAFTASNSQDARITLADVFSHHITSSSIIVS